MENDYLACVNVNNIVFRIESLLKITKKNVWQLCGSH